MQLIRHWEIVIDVAGLLTTLTEHDPSDVIINLCL